MALTDAWQPDDTFASRLILVRRQLGLDQRDIAKRCGLSSPTWASWELGTKPRDMDDVVRKIAAATGCDVVWLMFGTEQVAS